MHVQTETVDKSAVTLAVAGQPYEVQEFGIGVLNGRSDLYGKLKDGSVINLSHLAADPPPEPLRSALLSGMAEDYSGRRALADAVGLRWAVSVNEDGIFGTLLDESGRPVAEEDADDLIGAAVNGTRH